ncbi:hypothetical protein [Staphylococcus agnetis]|uniref:Uncharacterized protein n=1 Tax=Staphylococcus agnetis TaxID=985762 RepID=A0ABX3Z0C0_9STAP|nr:hypothetical protein [Staphylococcus agnetis]OSP12709.1 hypothetical protein B9L42_12465 [Staphylococcus agnetis]OSP19657.1 hypothetical protein B9M87_12510 [Staphylococcus agnetis]OTW30345.1 hypothetical protein B9M88_10520 [Staphylococcus agnetis]
MIFKNINDINKLEDAYEYEKKQIAKKFEELHDFKHQLRMENERSYDAFLYLKKKMNYSEESNKKMLNLMEKFDSEVDSYVRRTEREIFEYQDELKKAYLRHSDNLIRR